MQWQRLKEKIAFSFRLAQFKWTFILCFHASWQRANIKCVWKKRLREYIYCFRSRLWKRQDWRVLAFRVFWKRERPHYDLEDFRHSYFWSDSSFIWSIKILLLFQILFPAVIISSSRSKRRPKGTPLVQFLSLSCSFRQKICQIIG